MNLQSIRPRVINLTFTEEHDWQYIGRAKGQHGLFGNPILFGMPCCVCKKRHQDRTELLSCYRIYLFKRLQDEPDYPDKVRELAGRTLGCFCKPADCHGDILANAVVWLHSKEGLTRFPPSPVQTAKK